MRTGIIESREKVMANEYTVEVTETLQRQIVVTTDNENDAYNKIKADYNDSKIVLDHTDFIAVEINVMEKEVQKTE